MYALHMYLIVKEMHCIGLINVAVTMVYKFPLWKQSALGSFYFHNNKLLKKTQGFAA